MITPDQAVTIEDVSEAMFLRESVGEGEIAGRPCAITKPVGGASLMFELLAHEGKPRVQWLVKMNSEAIFNAMIEEAS